MTIKVLCTTAKTGVSVFPGCMFVGSFQFSNDHFLSVSGNMSFYQMFR